MILSFTLHDSYVITAQTAVHMQMRVRLSIITKEAEKFYASASFNIGLRLFEDTLALSHFIC